MLPLDFDPVLCKYLEMLKDAMSAREGYTHGNGWKWSGILGKDCHKHVNTNYISCCQESTDVSVAKKIAKMGMAAILMVLQKICSVCDPWCICHWYQHL